MYTTGIIFRVTQIDKFTRIYIYNAKIKIHIIYLRLRQRYEATNLRKAITLSTDIFHIRVTFSTKKKGRFSGNPSQGFVVCVGLGVGNAVSVRGTLQRQAKNIACLSNTRRITSGNLVAVELRNDNGFHFSLVTVLALIRLLLASLTPFWQFRFSYNFLFHFYFKCHSFFNDYIQYYNDLHLGFLNKFHHLDSPISFYTLVIFS